jgi:hypothetical protein
VFEAVVANTFAAAPQQRVRFLLHYKSLRQQQIKYIRIPSIITRFINSLDLYENAFKGGAIMILQLDFGL